MGVEVHSHIWCKTLPYMAWSLERVIKVKFSQTFLEPAYLVGYAYILTENFGFGKFFSFLDG